MAVMRSGESISRRQFGQSVGAAITAGVSLELFGAFSHAAPAAAAGKFPPGRYVDIHTHLGQTWNKNKELTAHELLGWMDANDIAQAIVLPLISPDHRAFR